MKRIRLDEHTLEIELTKQPLEDRTLMVVTGGVAGLSDLHTHGCGVQRHLGNEGGTAAAGGFNRTLQGLAVTDKLIEIGCPIWDLGDVLIADGGADGSHIHLLEEIAEGGIGGRTFELKAKRLVKHSVTTLAKALQIAQALTMTLNTKHCH